MPTFTPEGIRQWTELAWTRGLRLLAIVLIAFALVRLLKALTNRIVEIAKGQTRVQMMREQQTRTVSGLLYSVGVAVIVVALRLSDGAPPNLASTSLPSKRRLRLGSLAFGFGL